MSRNTALAVILSMLAAGSAQAAADAFDYASNDPYGRTMSWHNGDNGGLGFGPWSLTTLNGNTSGFFIGSSVSNGGRGNIGDVAWGMYANSGGAALALRTFTPGGANNSAVLAPGQVFDISLDNGSVDTNSTVGFNLLNSDGVDRFTFQFVGGGNNYVYNLGDGVAVDTGVPFTRNGLEVALTLGPNNSFNLTVQVIEGPSYTVYGTLHASDFDRVQLFNNNAGAGSVSDLYFNDMSVSTLPVPTVYGAVSRKSHGGVNYDVSLPLSGTPGIEPRLGGATGDYTVVVDFHSTVSLAGNPPVEVIAGIGMVGTGGTSNSNAVTVSSSSVAIPLTNVANLQTIQVRLNAVNGNTDVVIPMSILVGDANEDGAVNSADATFTRNHSGEGVSGSNYRADFNADGTINSADATVVRAHSGDALGNSTLLPAPARLKISGK